MWDERRRAHARPLALGGHRSGRYPNRRSRDRDHRPFFYKNCGADDPFLVPAFPPERRWAPVRRRWDSVSVFPPVRRLAPERRRFSARVAMGTIYGSLKALREMFHGALVNWAFCHPSVLCHRLAWEKNSWVSEVWAAKVGWASRRGAEAHVLPRLRLLRLPALVRQL